LSDALCVRPGWTTGVAARERKLEKLQALPWLAGKMKRPLILNRINGLEFGCGDRI
jgi:hypothetical protein